MRLSRGRLTHGSERRSHPHTASSTSANQHAGVTSVCGCGADRSARQSSASQRETALRLAARSANGTSARTPRSMGVK